MINYRGKLVEILRENNFKRFAEIGVWKSITPNSILKYIGDQIEEYWAVDPWDMDFAYTRLELRRSPEDWFYYHWLCCKRMMEFPQLKVVKMTSEYASTIFPDGYFDMVFIDANHFYKYVHADIGFWMPKVRKGGIISGHDYGGRHKGVKEAVDEWFGEDLETFNMELWMKRV